MPTIIQSMNPDYSSLYTGYDQQEVSLGLINPNIYASQDYQQKKIRSLAIGMLSKIVYAGFDHDATPTILPIVYEPSYNTVLAYNVRYVPPDVRKAILKLVLDTNHARILSNQPIIVDYYTLKRAIPQTTGCLRRYKTVGIGVRETLPLNEWPSIVTERSGYENHYRLGMSK